MRNLLYDYLCKKNELKVAITSEYLYKQPSSNENISYTLVSLINHDGDSLDCGHYVSDVFLLQHRYFVAL